ncbi:MAG TPA: transporter substrate-binding domain-containing protein [Burkholderiaceae bacterium]
MTVALAAIASGLLIMARAGAAEIVVRYPPPEANSDTRNFYQVELLALALRLGAAPGDQYRMEPANLPSMQQIRVVEELKRGELVDVMWTVTSIERENDLLPIRIPLAGGTAGWRIALVRAADVDRFADIKTLRELRKVQMAQGHDWPDLKILRSNGIPVQASTQYQSLFRMLASGRFDYFPRSLDEIWGEQREHADMKLVVEPHIALHYASASYYFVNRRNTALAEAIRRGLEKTLADGSYDRLIEKYFGDMLRRARLSERTVIEMENPVLPPQTPLKRTELWYDPKRVR